MPPIFYDSIACLLHKHFNSKHFSSIFSSLKTLIKIAGKNSCITKILEKVLKSLKPHAHTHTFIPKYFSKKSTKTPLGGQIQIIWLNKSFFRPRCSKASLVENIGCGENGETRNRDTRKAQIRIHLQLAI